MSGRGPTTSPPVCWTAAGDERGHRGTDPDSPLARSAHGFGRRQTPCADAYDAYLGAGTPRDGGPLTEPPAIEVYIRAIASIRTMPWRGPLAFTYGASPLNADARPAETGPRAREAAIRALAAYLELADAQFVAGQVNWIFHLDRPAAERRLPQRHRARARRRPLLAIRVLAHILSHRPAGPARRKPRWPGRTTSTRSIRSCKRCSGHRSPSRAATPRGRDPACPGGDSPRLHVLDWPHAARPGLRQRERAAWPSKRSGRRNPGLRWQQQADFAPRLRARPRTGRIAEARDVLRLLEARSRERYVPPYAFALVHAGLGDGASAFAWLEKAYAERDVHLIT